MQAKLASRLKWALLAFSVAAMVISGALLIALDPKNTKEVIAILAKNGIVCYPIGKLTKKNEGLKLFKKGKLIKMPTYKVDEITKVL